MIQQIKSHLILKGKAGVFSFIFCTYLVCSSLIISTWASSTFQLFTVLQDFFLYFSKLSFFHFSNLNYNIFHYECPGKVAIASGFYCFIFNFLMWLFFVTLFFSRFMTCPIWVQPRLLSKSSKIHYRYLVPTYISITSIKIHKKENNLLSSCFIVFCLFVKLHTWKDRYLIIIIFIIIIKSYKYS